MSNFVKIMTTITILGTGGVGGYFGGLLAYRYHDDPSINISFVARGEHLHQIQKNGLTIEHGDSVIYSQPYQATDDPSELGVQDYIIICTKTYHLDKACKQIQYCVGPNTVFLTLLNGVDSVEKLRKTYPDNLILNGCVDIYTKIKSLGVIENFGTFQKLYLGHYEGQKPEAERLYTIMKDAQIDATHANNILKRTWTKYTLIASIATASSYYDKSIGYVMRDHREDVSLLIDEIIQLAEKKSIQLSENLKSKTLQILSETKMSNTASMHRDFMKDRTKTEVESLTGYIWKESNSLGLHAPTFEKMYKSLIQ